MKRASALAAGLWVAFVIALLGAGYLGFNRPEQPITVIDALWAFSFIGFPTTGLLIVRRLPGRALGWIFLLAPLLLIVGVLFSELAEVAMGQAAASDPVPAKWTAWVSNVTFSSGLILFIFIPLLLPGGNLPSRRWRPVAGLAALAAAVWIASAMFAPGPLTEVGGVRNPLGIRALDGFFDAATTILSPVVLAVPLLGIGSLILRPRSAGGTERQQLKWLAFGAGTIALCIVSIWIMERVFGDLSDAVVTPIVTVAILAFPVTIGVAMLRYRLYDIDVIINRTLVYAVLTAALLGSYLLIVVALSRLLDPVTRDSDVAIAASTLAVAALFRPLRTRIQAFIDRRFYRSKYDAARALEGFGARLRDQIEVDIVRDDVLGVVRDTLQPRHASLWVRERIS